MTLWKRNGTLELSRRLKNHKSVKRKSAITQKDLDVKVGKSERSIKENRNFYRKKAL